MKRLSSAARQAGCLWSWLLSCECFIHQAQARASLALSRFLCRSRFWTCAGECLKPRQKGTLAFEDEGLFYFLRWYFNYVSISIPTRSCEFYNYATAVAGTLQGTCNEACERCQVDGSWSIPADGWDTWQPRQPDLWIPGFSNGDKDGW